LAPYVYRPYFSDLTDEEINEYIDKSSKIAQSYYGAQNEEEKSRFYELLCFQRQQIIQNAVRKYNVFETILDDIHNLNHCLVYCSPQQIERVQEVLNNRGIIQHKFTQEESATPEKKLHGKSERDTILQLFAEGTYQALVAMKCLDEGVDIPQARTAIILSSTGNPREYVQRRGRLLRRFPGKEFSTIYDIIVFPSLEFFRHLKGPLAEFEKKLVTSELKRYEEFSSTANNFIECLKILRDIEAKLEL
jgi:superfamily II DNA or RNA helicase